MADHELITASSFNEEDEELQRYIPHDLLTHHILIKLPITSLIRFKSVSKFWHSVISSPSFTNAHFKSRSFLHSSLPILCLFIQSDHGFYSLSYDGDESDDDNDQKEEDDIVSYYGTKGLIRLNCEFNAQFDKLYLVGSCNGLICLQSSSGFFIIWNPITSQFRKIPDPCLLDSCKRWMISWGFGYVSSVDDYKIVRIVEMPTKLEIMAHVFSLKSNEWRKVDHELHQHLFSLGKIMSTLSYANISLQSFETRRGVLLNEKLYWIAAHMEIWDRRIISFNLDLETFEKFPDLELTSNDLYCDKFLCVMGGCLSACGVNTRDDVYINILKSHGRKESRSLFRDMKLGSCQDLVGFTRTGKFFILDKDSKELGLIDPDSSPLKYTRLVRFDRDSNIDMVDHVPSFVSPFATG